MGGALGSHLPWDTPCPSTPALLVPEAQPCLRPPPQEQRSSAPLGPLDLRGDTGHGGGTFFQNPGLCPARGHTQIPFPLWALPSQLTPHWEGSWPWCPRQCPRCHLPSPRPLQIGATFPAVLPCHTCKCLTVDAQDPAVQCARDTCNSTCPQVSRPPRQTQAWRTAPEGSLSPAGDQREGLLWAE